MQVESLHVLLVEPSPTQARIVEGWLKDFGIRHLQRVDSGEAALAAMAGQPPDLVISAMHLPGMTGTDLVVQMREDDRFRDTAFILISSETGFRYLEPLRQAGVTAILPKPFDEPQLHTSLTAALHFLEPQSLDEGRFAPEELQVLLVDDLATARRFMHQILERMGIERIDEAANGVEARELIDRNFYDLIITDYHMPEMDGEALLNYIRNDSQQPSVPVLMVTSRAEGSRIAALQQAGVSAVFDKPFDVDSLRSMIESVLA